MEPKKTGAKGVGRGGASSSTAALELSAERYRAILESMEDFVDRHLPGGILTYVNPALARYVGVAPEDLIGTSWYPFVHEDDRAEVIGTVQALTAERPQARVVSRVVLSEGSVRWHQWNHQAFFDEAGNVREYQSVGRDITETKRMEEELRRSQASLQKAERIARLGNWEWDPRSNALRWSDEVYRIYGMDPARDTPSYEVVVETVAPEDRERFVRAVEEAVRHGAPFAGEYRMIGLDGKERFTHTIGEVARDPAGLPVTMFGIVQDVTERRRAELALKEREKQLAESQRIAHVGSWEHNLKTGGVFWSEELFRLLGLDPARDPADFGVFFGMVHPDDQPRLRSAIEETLREKKPFSIDYRFVFRDGTVREIHAQAELLPDAEGDLVVLSGTGQDITERRRTEDQIRHSERFIRSILDTVDEGFIVIDRDYRIVTANSAFCRQCGLSCDDVIGKSCFSISHRVNRPCHEEGEECAVREVFATGAPHHVVHKHFDSAGHIIFVETKAFPLRDDAGNVVSVIETVNNITERHLLEEERLKTQKLESIGTLAGGIAHDFNNLLQGIFGYISMAKLTLDRKEKSLEMLAQAEGALHQSVSLTTQLLTFSKGGRPQKRKIALGSVIERSARFALSGSQSTLRLEIAPDLWSADVDEGQVGQVIQNIVLNADQAMPAGGSVIITALNVPASEVPQGLARRDHVLIAVSDSGLGIAARDLERIFDPYFTTKQRGSGLGLATSYSIVRNHDGRIDVRSEPGTGTTFTIHLPAGEGRKAAVCAPPAAVPVARRGKVLLMDDDELVRSVAGELIRAAGHEPGFAADGLAACEEFRRARAAGSGYDVVILDLTIRGGMGGLETLRKLREIDPDVAAVVSSGYADEAVSADFERHGFRAFLKKPYDLADLGRTLGALLS